MAPGQILLSLASLVNYPPHQPQANTPCFGPGGPVSLPGAFGPSSHHWSSGTYPFDWGFKGLNGLCGPFRAPMVSTARGLWDPLGPFRPLLAKRGLSMGPPEPIFLPNGHRPQKITSWPPILVDLSPEDFNHSPW
ncbi:hypothetical protein O181_125686 [Austropuccinia psidii MF-1]|uniref:Uncharacterized protein n=1 Tax=Austropuccinia psidii MF-1 TaxID=1389203 RepID=A0A9Q3KTM6_9BASI|nr:hypothetical protein [Austropuccinia psidii MF-1]